MMSHPLISHFLQGKRVVSSAERALVVQAQELLDEAGRQAAAVVDEARLNADSILADARQKAGQYERQASVRAEQAARDSAARTLAAQGSARARKLVSMDERIGILVTRTLNKVLNDSEVDERFFSSVMQKVLRAARDEKFLSLRVCPEQLEAARKSVARILGEAGATQFVDVSADPELHRGSCLVESEHGVIDASLDTQLEAIQQALTNVWRKPGV